jgi:hypothetical protein
MTTIILTPITGAAAYVSVAQLRNYLGQVPDNATTDAQMVEVITRAQAIVDGELGFSFAGYDSAASARRINSYGGQYLTLPYYQAGTITAVALAREAADPDNSGGVGPVTLPTAWPITDYEVEPDNAQTLWRPGGWYRGRYSVTAKWGYGTAPDSVVQVTLEVAVNLWQTRDRGMTTLNVGVEGGGGQPFARALTWEQRDRLERVREQYVGWVIG